MSSDRAIYRAAEQMSAAQRAELEQAKLRVTIPGIVLIVFAGYVIFGEKLSASGIHALWFTIGFFLFAIAITLHLLATRGVSVVRRYVGIVADTAGNTYFMLAAGELGVIVFFIYLFLIFGIRLRWGRPSMLVCWGLSLLGLGTVLLFSDFWSHQPWVACGILLAVLALPSYVDFLVRRIEEARKRAEEACRRTEAALEEARQQVRELSRKLAGLAPPTA